MMVDCENFTYEEYAEEVIETAFMLNDFDMIAEKLGEDELECILENCTI